MNIATFSMFHVYIITMIVTTLVLYWVVPLVMSLFVKEIPAEAVLFWHRLRTVLFLLVLTACAVGAASMYFQNEVPSRDMPSGRSGAEERTSSYEERHK